MHRAKRVKPLNNDHLLVEFDNGEIKVYNCLSLMEEELFANLNDPEFFKTVLIDDMGLVCWNEATDINPYELYEASVYIEETDFTFFGSGGC